MVLPLYLAMTGAEMSALTGSVPNTGWMACHFSPYGQGLTNIPRQLPEGSMLILNDRIPIQGHSPDLVAAQLQQAVDALGCSCVLLDFQREQDGQLAQMSRFLVKALPCPTGVSEAYGRQLECPIFLPPCPLHMAMQNYLQPWNGREIWLEAALCQEEIRVSQAGTAYCPQFPPEGLEGGFFDKDLCCRYRQIAEPECVRFQLYDTGKTLLQKLEAAAPLGAAKAIGLYQQLKGVQNETALHTQGGLEHIQEGY